MNLFTLYLMLCLQPLHRTIIRGAIIEDQQQLDLFDTSCILNRCGLRDKDGIVTICEGSKISNGNCFYPQQSTPEPQEANFKTFCEDIQNGKCSSDLTNGKGIIHSVIKNAESSTSAIEINQEGGVIKSTNSDSIVKNNKDISAQLLAKLQELMSNHEPTIWPTNEFLKHAEDTFYSVVVQENCKGPPVHDNRKYSPIRIYIQEQLRKIDSKGSFGGERFRSNRRTRKRSPARYTGKQRRFRDTDHSHDHEDDTVSNQIHERVHHDHVDEQDKETLQHVYGKKTYSEHESDFEQVGKMGQEDNGAIEHKLTEVNNHVSENMDDLIDQARMNAVNDDVSEETDKKSETDAQLDSVLVKNMLKELLHKLDDIEHDPKLSKSISHGHCNIHGLWLSTVAGAAIELLPDSNGVINTKIMDLPQPPEGALINSQWTGTGMISKESPTTITIVFQEHITQNKDDTPPPRTAVFVGQCLVCDSSPMLQGTWILFPNSQNCFPLTDKANSPASDIMYQIRR